MDYYADLMDRLDQVKLKLTEWEYKNLVETLAKARNERLEIYEIDYLLPCYDRYEGIVQNICITDQLLRGVSVPEEVHEGLVLLAKKEVSYLTAALEDVIAREWIDELSGDDQFLGEEVTIVRARRI